MNNLWAIVWVFVLAALVLIGLLLFDASEAIIKRNLEIASRVYFTGGYECDYRWHSLEDCKKIFPSLFGK